MNTDLRVVKTHRVIREAFVELLLEMPFEQVRIHHITERALVNRSTFYKYYSGKSDLAGKIIADLRIIYQQAIQARFSSPPLLVFLQEMTQTLFRYRHEFLAMLSIKTRRHHFYDDIHHIIKNGFIKHANEENGERDWDYQATLYATVLLETLIYYFRRDEPVPIQQTATHWREMMEIVTAGIKQ